MNSDLIYNLLKAGATEDEILKSIKDAKAKIDAEEDREIKVEAAREILIEDILDYLIALGFTDFDNDDDKWESAYDSLEKSLIDYEKAYKKLMDKAATKRSFSYWF